MSLLETISIAVVAVIIFVTPIHLLVTKASKNRVLGHRFSRTTNYVLLFGLIVLLLVYYLVKK